MMKPDDERTLIQGAPFPNLPGEYADALPASTRLHEFEILSVIGQGGFGIVYLAHDLTLDRHVAIKEYMPSALATRTQSMTVSIRSDRHAETFAAGLRSFVNEARLLAQFDHPSLLKVYRFWEDHGTAYMVMPYYLGTTLGNQLNQLTGPPDEVWLKALLSPLLDALAMLHAARCFHRDIAPDNILILPDGRPLLLDFGAARRVIGDMTQALTVILKTGFAPIEQYGAMPNLSQGAWTDLYALGSVVELAITGRTPPQAIARFLADKREPLGVLAAGRYSHAFLTAIDCSLAVLPQNRPQSVEALRALMDAGVTQAEVLSAPPQKILTAQRPAPLPTESSVPSPRTAPHVTPRVLVAGGAAVLMALAMVAGVYAWLSAAPAPPADPVATTVRTIPPPAPMTPPTVEPSAVPVIPDPVQPQPESAVPDRPTPTPPVHIGPSPHARDTPRMATIKPPAQVAPRPPPEMPPTPRIPNKILPNERCADIIQRASLGEELSNADKGLIKRECNP